MDPRDQSHVVLREDMGMMKNQLNQLREAMSSFGQREDNIQWTVVIENVNPPIATSPTQPHLVRISVKNPAIKEHHIVQYGHISPHDENEWPQDTEIVKICHELEERFKAIDGCDTYGFDTLDLCLVKNMVISPKFKTLDFEKYKGISYPKTHLAM